MPSLNFHKQFVLLIESGQKRQTIRPKRKNPIKVGDKLYLFTGLRTKKCKRLIIDPLKIETYRNPSTAYVGVICKSVEWIRINDDLGFPITLSSDLERLKISDIIKADGFNSTDEFINFFKTKYGLPFEGVLIKW